MKTQTNHWAALYENLIKHQRELIEYFDGCPFSPYSLAGGDERRADDVAKLRDLEEKLASELAKEPVVV